ncbi:MAG: hypothetical protein CMJ46_14325 [Planctomyces sp.]|nr:hypothetical protein [Planctomyces sp.]
MRFASDKGRKKEQVDQLNKATSPGHLRQVSGKRLGYLKREKFPNWAILRGEMIADVLPKCGRLYSDCVTQLY